MKWLVDNVGIYTADQIYSLEKLIKEQDRDTRHACAEAVIQCDKDASGECIVVSEAHSACMNTQAV
jgi:hypothetical protein